MKTNLEYFHISEVSPEPVFDPHYGQGRIVIPPTCHESNALTQGNKRLIELICAFNVLKNSQSLTLADAPLSNIVDKTIEVLDATEGINCSAFSQFFLVYSSSYSFYKKLPESGKRDFVYTMLERFCVERHDMYMSHGYTDSMLQVVADNYSHKRHSKTTILKLESILEQFHIYKRCKAPPDWTGFFYFLPDKDGKRLFSDFKRDFGLRFEYSTHEQGKLPDMVLGLGSKYCILELKNMKGSGGGQDKQIAEVVNFIRYAESDSRLHYMAFLDGEYWNILTGEATRKRPKIASQYNDILGCLESNPGNYFVNTAGLRAFLADVASGH